MSFMTQRLGDVNVSQPGLDQTIGIPSNELQALNTGLAATNQVVDTQFVICPTRFKSLVIVVDSPITSSAGQQGTVQLFVARSIYGTLGGDTATAPGGTFGVAFPQTPFPGSSAAASGFPTTGPNAAQLVGSAVNFGPSGTSIAVGTYWFTTTSPGNPNASPPTTLTELTQMYPCVGVEIKFPAAPTGGAYRVFFEFSPL